MDVQVTFRALVVIALLAAGSVLLDGTDVDSSTMFLLLTAVLVVYLAAEVRSLRARRPERWLLDPGVWCSLTLFLLGFGVTNLFYFLPAAKLELVGLRPEITPGMIKLMVLVVLAATAMWIGYWSRAASAIAERLRRSVLLSALLRSDFQPRFGALLLCAGLGLASRLISIALGIYGYSATPESLEATEAFRQYLTIAEGIGKFALILAALWYFSPQPRSAAAGFWLAGLLAGEVLFGFLSGFKAQVVAPFVVVGMCQYFRTGRVPWRFVAVVPLAVIVAYMVIEPFRYARYTQWDYTGKSVDAIASTMIEAAQTHATSIDTAPDASAQSPALLLFARMNVCYIASRGIDLEDADLLPPGSPAFLRDIALAPLYAVIPRFLWPSKTESHHGQWYAWAALDLPAGGRTSIAMSPFTYLYFAGGASAVMLGFLAVGILQRAVAEQFLRSRGGGGAAVLFIVLPVVTNIDSAFYSVIVEIIRTLPIALTLQYVVYRR